MKISAIFLVIFMVWALKGVKAAEETVEVTSAEKEVVSEQLDSEAETGKFDEKTKAMLKKVSLLFKQSKEKIEVQLDLKNEDCSNCSKKEKAKNIFTQIGRKLGKGAAWVATTTGKPFVTGAGFVAGAVEKGDKNKEVASLYQFFLNHEEEYDGLYAEAGTPEELAELMLLKTEEIMEDKSRLIIKDFLAHLGLEKEIPEDLRDFELSAEELAKIDRSKLDASFINNHPEYKEVRGVLGDLTNEDVVDIVTTGHFSKTISFDKYKAALPNPFELVGAISAQIIVPKIALGLVSKTLAGLYVAPVIASQIGTAVSVQVCSRADVREKLKTDSDLKSFCSYTTNRTAYQLMKGRAKGYVAGKKFRGKVAEKIKRLKEKREEKRRQKEQSSSEIPKLS